MSATDRRKLRKREVKRKRRERRKEEQGTTFTNLESAKVTLAAIIKQIYEGSNNFEKSKADIEASIAQLVGYDKFHVFLN
jgi:hypothetical protein